MLDTFTAVLKSAVAHKSSDVHISAGGPFRVRYRGELVPVKGSPSLTPADTATIAAEIVLGARKATRETLPEYMRQLTELDCSYSVAGVGRFRVNVCSQRGSVSIVLRTIAEVIPTFEHLGLPPVLARRSASEERGLVPADRHHRQRQVIDAREPWSAQR